MADYEKRLQAFDESSRRLNVTTSSQRNDIPKSAPVPTQTRDSQLSEIQATNDGSSERLNDGNGGDRRVSYIDDFRLRQLLEELYKDKKYFDQFVEATGLYKNVDIIVE